MPNWVNNRVTIVGSAETIKRLVEANMDFEVLRPRPKEMEDQWYNWNVEHWGTKWNRVDYEVFSQKKKKLECSFDTAWSPPTAFFDHLLDLYHDLWIKCEWDEEGDTAGVWVAHWKDDILVKSSTMWEEHYSSMYDHESEEEEESN